MPVVFTPMPIFNKPGPMRDLLAARGFSHAWAFSDTGRKGRPSDEETRAALLGRAAEIEYYLANTVPLDKVFFEKAVNLKHVSMFGVGLDHIDIAAATERGVVVSNVPGGNARCVAEMALCFMLDLAHRMNEMREDLRRGVWRQRLGGEITGKTLGVVGLGHIGREVARIAKAFGMTVLAVNRTPRPETVLELGIEQVSFEEMLPRADFVSLHIPGGAPLWRFGAQEFAAMKKGAFFINTARGDLADLDALTAALESGHIAGAGLDVFPVEPMDLRHPIFSLPQVSVSPHAGGMSAEAMLRVTEAALEAFGRTEKGLRTPLARNPEVYDSPLFRGRK